MVTTDVVSLATARGGAGRGCAENMRRNARHAPPPAGTRTRFLGNRARTRGGAGVADECYDARTPGLPQVFGANAVGPGCGRLYVFEARWGEMRAGVQGHRFLSFLRVVGVSLGSGRGANRLHLSRTQLRLVLAGEVGFGLSIRFQTWVHSCNGSGRLGVTRNPEAPRRLPSPGTRPETTEKRSPQDRLARTAPTPTAPQHTHTHSRGSASPPRPARGPHFGR